MEDQIENNAENKKPIYVFFHICCINNYIDVVGEIVDQIVASGLYEKCEKIFYSILGTADNAITQRLSELNKFELIHTSADIKEVEYPTLINLYNFCSTNDPCHVLYLHTKGVSLPGDKFRQLWRKRLLQKTVTEYDICISHLNEGYDISGSGWKEVPKRGEKINYCAGDYPHYSGNFWWANSEYIKRLPDIKDIRDKYLNTKLSPAGITRQKYRARDIRFNRNEQDIKVSVDVPVSFFKYRLMCEFWIGMIQDVKYAVNGELNKEYSNKDYCNLQ